MKTLLASVATLALVFVAARNGVADDGHGSSTNFATVKLFFLNQWLPDPSTTPNAEMAQGGGGLGGGMMSTHLHFETARLYLNDQFIGNAMFRHVEVNPTLNLPPGDHRFRIECEGYEKFEESLTVLQNGSVQWLVVKLDRVKSAPIAQPTRRTDETNKTPRGRD